MHTIRPAVLAAALLLARCGEAADIRPLPADLPRAGDLAATPDGEFVACVDEGTGAIVIVSPGSGQSSRVAVTAPTAGGPRPVAIGFIDATVLAAVCRAGSEWSLRTWRLRLTAPAAAASPLQSVDLSRAAGREPGTVHLVVGRSGRWLAVVGLDPPVIRAVLGGVRIGPPSTRLCPQLAEGRRPVAAAVGPADELVVVSGRQGAEQSGESVAFFGADGRCLLDLETGLRGIRDISFTADGSSLYAVAAEGSGQRPGLWRLDAAARDGRQVIRPVLVAELPDPRALVCPDPRGVILTRGGPERSVVQVQPREPAVKEEP